jgi:adenosylhomocysteine nucleosidase
LFNRHPIIAVTGLSFEARIASGPGVVALCSSDPHQLSSAISIEVLRGFIGIVSFGIAGGLCPNLAPGTCVVARLIVTPQERFAADGAWSRHLLRSIPGAVHADIAGGHTLISDPATKRSLGNATGAVAVDMESSLSAAPAARHNVPFAAVRVLADPSHRALPHVAQVAVLENGRLDFSAIPRSPATQPRQWGDVIRTAFDTRKARLVLRQSRALIGLQFGLVGAVEEVAESGVAP